MSIEYTFKSSCYPIGERRICEIDSLSSLFTSPAYSQILGALGNEGVHTDDVLSLWYKQSKWDKWRKVEDEPLASGGGSAGKIFVKVQLKPCVGQVQERLNKMIDELKEENRSLRQQFDGLSTNLKHIQRQIDEFKVSGPRLDYTPPYLQANASATPTGDSFEKDLDVAYLYAIPLVRKGTQWRRNEPIRDPIDIHKEISALEKVFVGSKKELQVTISSGNVANLRHILSQRPKILHISCHGGYECDSGEVKPYLYLEDAKQPGMMEKFDEETIRGIFSIERDPEEEVRPRVVFISACHSQRFGEIIKETGVPNVIAVNQYTQVADESAIGFATSFDHFLLKGKSVKDAFNCTKSEERYSNMSINLCCCAHRHEADCLWSAKKDENIYEAHAMHVPSCDCKFGGNLHKPNCRWLKELPSDLFEVAPKASSNLKRVCCCSSQIPHEEEEKFILMSQSMEAANEKVFDEAPAGEANVIKGFVEELVPKTDEVLIGRNIEVQQLIELLSCDPGKKIITVIGPSRVGKRLIIRTAAKYIMECVDTAKHNYENFPDGFVTIRLNSTLWLLSKLNGALLPPPNVEARSLEELPKRIQNQRKLVVLECEHVMDTNAFELINKLREILKEGVKIKFIVIAQKRVPELDVDEELVIKENLDMVSAYSIIKSKIPDWKTSYIKFCKTRLAQEMRTPWLIKRAAILLKEHSEDEVYERLRSEENPSKTTKHESSLENTLRTIEEKCGTLFPVYLLAQTPTGLFEYMLEELAGESKPKLDSYIESETLPVVTKTSVEELGEVRYRLFDDMISYINEAKLSPQERATYQFLCIKALAHISRCLIRSYNFLRYKCVNYNEFSAILGDGIWAPLKHLYTVSVTLNDPIARFQHEKDNVISLFDPNVLTGIVQETHPNQLPELLDNVKELTMCAFTLIHSFRPTEAMHIVDAVQGFVNKRNNNFYDRSSPLGIRYAELEATIALIKGSIALNHTGQLEIAEGMKDAERAEELFNDIKNHAGIGEALFLQGLFLEQLNKRYDVIEGAYSSALISFSKAGCKLGEARVSLAKGILLLDSMRSDGVLELLTRAINILKEHKYFNNMLGICRYRRGRYYLRTRNYELSKEDIEKALEDFGEWNNCAVDKCNVSLQELSELMQENCPIFSFLKAVPLVMRDDENLLPLEPNMRSSIELKDTVNTCFNEINKSVKTYLSTLTLENLRYIISRNCTILHISSNHYEDGYLSMEGQLGDLDKISLEELYNELKGSSGLEKCKVVVVSIPKAEDIAQMFVDLKIPHVIFFSFANESFFAQPSELEDHISKGELMYKFSVDFYICLAKGMTVHEAWQEAKDSVAEFVVTKCEALKIKNFQYEKELNPILLPPGRHDEQVLTNLQTGNFIDISPKCAECDIEKDRRPFVGRQIEMYSIAKALHENQCVNLYGKCGVGKTRLAKEIGYFMFMRVLFKSYICYFDDLAKEKNFKAEMNTKLQYAQSNDDSIPLLVIIDNMTREIWQREKQYFKILQRDHNCVFLFISQKFLVPEDGQFVPMVNYELLPFDNYELSLDMVFGLVNTVKGFPINSLLRVETGSYSDLRTAMAALKGFHQANGYPRLLTIFAKRVLEECHSYSDLEGIDMLKDKKIDPKFKKVMKRVGKERASEILYHSGLTSQFDDNEKRISFNLKRSSKANQSNTKRVEHEHNRIKHSSRSLIFTAPLNRLSETAAENEATPTSNERNSFIGKGLLKLERPRDVSPIEDHSQDSSESGSGEPAGSEDSNSYSTILAGELNNDEDGKELFDYEKHRRSAIRKSNVQPEPVRWKTEISPRGRRKSVREKSAAEHMKKIRKGRKSPARRMTRLIENERMSNANYNIEEHLDPIESEPDGDST